MVIGLLQERAKNLKMYYARGERSGSVTDNGMTTTSCEYHGRIPVRGWSWDIMGNTETLINSQLGMRNNNVRVRSLSRAPPLRRVGLDLLDLSRKLEDRIRLLRTRVRRVDAAEHAYL